MQGGTRGENKAACRVETLSGNCDPLLPVQRGWLCLKTEKPAAASDATTSISLGYGDMRTPDFSTPVAGLGFASSPVDDIRWGEAQGRQAGPSLGRAT